MLTVFDLVIQLALDIVGGTLNIITSPVWFHLCRPRANRHTQVPPARPLINSGMHYGERDTIDSVALTAAILTSAPILSIESQLAET